MSDTDAVDACLLVHKPTGITSAALVAEIKRRAELAKVGHGGTLDRFASGLMLLFCGRATKLCPLFISLDKRYTARIRLGSETSTLDPEGEVLYRSPQPSRERVEQALAQLTSFTEQLPPDFSALHVKGQRAYQLARKGEKPALKPRAVRLYAARLTAWHDNGEFDLSLHCSSGYYVRALARDLGHLSGSHAHLRQLTRTAIGPFKLEQAELPAAVVPQPAMKLLKELDLPQIEAEPDWDVQFQNGRMPPLQQSSDSRPHLLTDQGRLLAVVRYQQQQWRYQVNFYPGI